MLCRAIPRNPLTQCPFQPPGLLHTLEHALNGLSLGVEGFPLRPIPPDNPEQADVLFGVLPVLGIAVQDAAPSRFLQVAPSFRQRYR